MDENSNSENYLAKWLQGELSQEEIQKLSESDDLRSYESIVNEIDTWKVKDLELEPSYQTLKGKLDETGGKVIKLQSSKKMWYAIAASLLLLVVSYFVFVNFSKENIVTYASVSGEQKDIELPDGTEIVLGGKTTLSYNENNFSSKREVTLNGQAYFKVVKGAGFKVNLGKGQVEVLGTKYDIRSSDDYFSVQCYEGRVKIDTEDDESAILVKGDGIHYISGQPIEKFKVNTNEPEWISKNSIFRNTTLIEVIDALEAQYPIEINSDKIDINRRFTGSFVNHDLEKALKLVFDPLDIQYEVNGKKVVLK